jgi:hypothetical protein
MPGVAWHPNKTVHGGVDYWHYSVGYIEEKYARGQKQSELQAVSYVYTAPPVCKNKDLSCYFQPIPCSPPGGRDAWIAKTAGMSHGDLMYAARQEVSMVGWLVVPSWSAVVTGVGEP